MCGGESWAGGSTLVELGGLRPDPPLDALPFVCTGCGFVRLHAVQPLETIDD
jgi:hypothetical protein